MTGVPEPLIYVHELAFSLVALGNINTGAVVIWSRSRNEGEFI